MVMTSEFIVVRTGAEMLICFDNRSVHACVWLIVTSSSLLFFFWEKPCKVAIAS